MKVKDKNVKEMVEVVGKRCLTASCYWPRPDPGSFTQGVGYSQRKSGKLGWLCGTREIHGCPYRIKCPECGTANPESTDKCYGCGYSLANPKD